MFFFSYFPWRVSRLRLFCFENASLGKTHKGDTTMIFAGIVVTLLGFVVSVSSLGMTERTGGRMGMVLVGIALSLVGNLGFINTTYLKNANWRK